MRGPCGPAPDGLSRLAKAELLLAANLLADVRASVAPAVAALDAAGMATDAAEGRLVLAQALAIQGDVTALEQAEAARQAFVAARRRGWAALARLSGAA